MYATSSRLALGAAVLGCCLAAARADTGGGGNGRAAEPQNVVTLAASASVEVARDLLSVTLTTTREGSDAQQVQAALKQALDAALAEARKAARPGQVEVQTGNFSLYPRYGNPGRGGAPAVNGWQGTAELLIEGRDMPAIAALTGRIPSMTVGRVGYGLSREQREKVEADVAAQAIARFRARAGEIARQFGFSGHSIREVSVSSGEPSYPPVPMMRAQAMSAAAEAAPLPVEAGTTTVTVTVSGSVQMK